MQKGPRNLAGPFRLCFYRVPADWSYTNMKSSAVSAVTPATVTLSTSLTWLTLVLGLSVVGLGQAGQGYTTTIYEGQIKAVKIVKCGMQPGLCEGSIILARQGSEDTQVDVRIGTWIKRGGNFLTIEDLNIGDQVKAQTFRLPGDTNPRVAILEFTRP